MSVSKQIIFIDSKVPDYQSIIAGLPANAIYYLVDSNGDGLQQIADILWAYHDVTAAHVISHGAAGSLQLGNSTINQASLQDYNQALTTIGNALTATGDILLYGCNVAQGDTGQQFIQQLASMTGADIAASTNLTGAASQGGDWILEAATGVIESPVISFTESYKGLLAANSAPTFVVGGKVTTDFNSTSDIGYSVTTQADGKILVAGYSQQSHNYYASSDFGLARYNSDGSLDTSFGGNGKITTAFGFWAGSYTDVHVTVQADGKILAVGTTGGQLALARYNSDGSLDTSFDANGEMTTSLSDYYPSVTMQADGKVLLAGLSYDSNYNRCFTLLRYNSDGSLDSSFDGNGKATTSLSSFTPPTVTMQADGKVLLTGVSYDSNYNSYLTLLRYNSDGSLDTSFDGNGKTTTALNSYDHFVTNVQTDGKILVAGTGYSGFVLLRYNSDGSLDTSFDGDGKVTTAMSASPYTLPSVFSITVQTDGKILIAGQYEDINYGEDFALLRYNSDGSLDTTFNGDGKVTTAFSSASPFYGATGHSVTVQADGKILVAGVNTGVAGSDFALARYNSDGSLDHSFNAVNTLDGISTYTKNGAAVVLDSTVLIYDAELASLNNFNGASITLARHGGAAQLSHKNIIDIWHNITTLPPPY